MICTIVVLIANNVTLQTRVEDRIALDFASAYLPQSRIEYLYLTKLLS